MDVLVSASGSEISTIRGDIYGDLDVYVFVSAKWKFHFPRQKQVRPMMALLKYECSLSDGDNHRWWGYSNSTWLFKKIELFALSGSGDAKKKLPLCSHLRPTIHLVEFPLPNILCSTVTFHEKYFLCKTNITKECQS